MNMIASIATGVFTGLGSDAELYVSKLDFPLHCSNRAWLLLPRSMDMHPTTKAPFNMLSGTQLSTLYVTFYSRNGRI
jgi:hypothetical protein